MCMCSCALDDSRVDHYTYLVTIITYRLLYQIKCAILVINLQMVDLDWGIQTKKGDIDSSKNDFRFDELYKCQSLSAGPSFVVSTK